MFAFVKQNREDTEALIFNFSLLNFYSMMIHHSSSSCDATIEVTIILRKLLSHKIEIISRSRRITDWHSSLKIA